MLAPTWRLGDIVIMDNLAAHKVAGVLQAVVACGAEFRYLPPYSPDFNPIENAFAKFKAHVRKSHALTRRCDGRAFARFLLRSLAACGRILAALRGWAADIERRTDAQIVGAVKDPVRAKDIRHVEGSPQEEVAEIVPRQIPPAHRF